MYIAVVALTMLVLPAVSMAVEHGLHPDVALIVLLGRWFVFWGLGVRLALAGARQALQPAFTARHIFHISGDEALVIVQELGIANLSASVVGLLSLGFPTFVTPAAIYGVVFYGVAGARHVGSRDRSTNETIALASDLFMALVLAAFLVGEARA